MGKWSRVWFGGIRCQEWDAKDVIQGIHIIVRNVVSYKTHVDIQKKTVMWTLNTKMLYSEMMVEPPFQTTDVSYKTLFPQCERQLDMRFVWLGGALSRLGRPPGQNGLI